MKKIQGMFLLAVLAILGMVQNALAFPPATADTTAMTAVSTDLLLWFSPIIAIALTVLAYRRVKGVVK